MNTRQNLILVARRLGALRERMVFVGGATVELLLSDAAAGPVRPTDDVDVVVPVQSRLEYLQHLSGALRMLGFREDRREDAPICRWVVDGVTVDVMPTSEEILGFSNRWYGSGLADAVRVELEPGLEVNVLSAPYFVATKLEAFRGRGRGDYLASADIEDIVTTVNGRPSLLEELRLAESSLRAFVASEVAALLANTDFQDALPGHLPGDPGSQARLPLVRARLQAVAKLPRD